MIDKVDLSLFVNIIGFDFGRGQFSLTQISDNTNDTPKTIKVSEKKNQIAAVAITHKNEVLIGDSAITGDYEEIKEVWVGFKRRPNGDSEFDRKIKLLMSEVIRKSKENGKIVIDKNTLILVGCPSEWEPKDQREYQKTLGEIFDGFFSDEKPTLVVIPESKAVAQTVKLGCDLNTYEFKNSIVAVIDIGSSAINITCVKSGKEIQYYECDLGSFLIDELLLCDVIFLLDEDDRNIVLEALKSNQCNIGKCLVKAREVREIYFEKEKSAFNEKRTITRGPVILELKDGSEFEFDIRISMGRLRYLINNVPLITIKESIIKWGIKRELFFFPPAKYQSYSYYNAVDAFLWNTMERDLYRTDYESYGSDLSFLIDELLLCETISRLDEDDRNIVLEALKNNHNEIGSCLVKAREVKKSYFNQEKTAFKEKRTITRGPVFLELQDGDDFEFDIRITMGDFRKLINSTPLSRIRESIINWGLNEDLFSFSPDKYKDCSYNEASLMDIRDNITPKILEDRFLYLDKIQIAGDVRMMENIKKRYDTFIIPNHFINDQDSLVATGLTLLGRAEIKEFRDERS